MQTLLNWLEIPAEKTKSLFLISGLTLWISSNLWIFTQMPHWNEVHFSLLFSINTGFLFQHLFSHHPHRRWSDWALPLLALAACAFFIFAMPLLSRTVFHLLIPIVSFAIAFNPLSKVEKWGALFITSGLLIVLALAIPIYPRLVQLEWVEKAIPAFAMHNTSPKNLVLFLQSIGLIQTAAVALHLWKKLNLR